MRVLSDLRIAITLLTLVPARGEAAVRPSPACVAWFPLIGMAFGAIGAAAGLALTRLGPHFAGALALVFAAVTVSLWALLGRLLHWDGLADTADALWGGHTPQRRLEIMADSATGAFGATAIALVAVLQVTALAVLFARPVPLWPVVVAVPLLGRTAALFAAWLGKPARPGGLGALVIGRPPAFAVAIAVLTFTAAGILLALTVAPVWLLWYGAGLVVAAAVPHLFAGRVGGVTGDIMGASVLVTETVVLLVAAIGGSV
jgi:adenosylcobinamide-GDP ribazoletransferase